ncbi:hypothetical protein V1512DRAFT_260474 [Lipomyces arxii]|uniref:uncharacterized protein n=1 Tax=Lipomyces arxii TaxID=56418 RepID=UPI0034CD0B8B
MANIDYDALRKLPDANGASSETVAVNHRALITRTLSKYPVDHALFRELIQNSADAGATTVKIEFMTEKPVRMDSITDIHKSTVKRLRISNDGMSFRPDDWDRLREIAKGNPDETKIGAFGVGFYSVFAVTDEPMVVSGPTAMNFYYVGDQLHYRRIKVPETTGDAVGWTTIDLPYPSPKPLPELQHFTSFLAQSLTFVKLQQIVFTVDGISLLTIQKIKSEPIPMSISREINLKSLDQTMKLERAETEAVQIKAKYLNATQLGKSETEAKGLMAFGLKFIQAFTSEAEKPSEYTDAVIFLRNVTGYIITSPSSSFAKKLQGAIMKPPPKHASISMIALNKDEADSSQLKSGIAAQIFPKSFADAKVFIGFPTKQTTALKSHIAAPQAIPTMERAAVDTANAYVKDWNKEMMYMAGVLTRIVYGSEMNIIGALIDKSGNIKNSDDLFAKAGYIMRQFYFDSSTPDARIGQYIATGFWKSAPSVPLVTTKGVLPSTEARAMEDISFLKDVPMIPKEMYNEASEFHDQVKTLSLIKSVDVYDVKNEFSRRPLGVDDAVAFLKWAIKKLKDGSLAMSQITTMIGYALLADPKLGTVDMRSLMFYHNSSIIPDDMPVPYNCLPYGVAKEIRNADLEMLGWTPIDVVSWLQFLSEGSMSLPLEHNITVTPDFSREVLTTVSRQWYSLSNSSHTSILKMLQYLTCIPTQKGMKKPGESYLDAVKLFKDLPVVDAQLKAKTHEDMLIFLGIRKTIELKYVMERLHSDEVDRKWSSADMITYLASQQKDMRSEDIKFLQANEIVAAENEKDGRLYRVSELYQPLDDHRDLKLPVLQWPTDWNPKSVEAAFLFRLGLHRYPSVDTVVELAANAKDSAFRMSVLSYFTRLYEQNNYRTAYKAELPIKFLPATIAKDKAKEEIIVAPSECYSHSSVSLFDFPVLKTELQVEAWKFGVAAYAPIELVVQRLIAKPPTSIARATEMFNYMAGKLGELKSNELTKLKDSEFVPISNDGTKIEKYQSPSRVFVESSNGGSSGDDSAMFYKNFFDFVSFDVGADTFLRYCGARDRPSVVELASSTVTEPNAMLVQAGSSERYLELLRQFERCWNEIATHADLVTSMKRSPFLLARRYAEKEVSFCKQDNGNKSTEIDEDEYFDTIVEENIDYVLALGSDIVINDDIVNFNFFKKDIYSVPFDNILERLYERLGSLKMSNVVQESITVGANTNAKDSASLRKRILERLTIYLDMNSHDSVKVPIATFEKHFLLAPVTSITIQRSIIRLRGRRIDPVITPTTATVMSRTKGEYTLYVVPNMEWFDVAQALVKTVLVRPTPDAATVVESLMNSTLVSLERRGYNVKRLMQARLQEERAAQAAEQKLIAQAKEQERLRIAAEEQAAAEAARLRKQYAEQNRHSKMEPLIPGLDNHLHEIGAASKMEPKMPQHTLAPTPADGMQHQHSSSLMSRFMKTRKPTRESSNSSLLQGTASIIQSDQQQQRQQRQQQHQSHQQQRPVQQSTIEPEIEQMQTRTPGGWDDSPSENTQANIGSATPSPGRGESGNEPLSDEATRRLLVQGIRHVAPYNSNQLRSEARTWVPEQDAVQSAAASAEQMCDNSVAHDLQYVGMVTKSGPKLFAARSLMPSGVPTELHGHLRLMSATLQELATNVFNARWDAFQIFYDPNGRSVAFNSGGSLFFNLRYFVDDVRNTQVSRSNTGAISGFNMAKALDYWFPVVAHEMAHNLAHSHGQEHSYFTETYIQKYAMAYRRVAKMHDS